MAIGWKPHDDGRGIAPGHGGGGIIAPGERDSVAGGAPRPATEGAE
jgi:hypothetical protein